MNTTFQSFKGGSEGEYSVTDMHLNLDFGQAEEHFDAHEDRLAFLNTREFRHFDRESRYLEDLRVGRETRNGTITIIREQI